MFRKFNLKTLSGIFIALLAVVMITRFVDASKGVNTLKAYLFEINDEDVTSIVVEPRMLNGKSIELVKSGDQWIVKNEGHSYNGDAGVIDGLIRQVNKLKPIRLAARNSDKWEKYELSDSLSSVVKLMKNDTELARLYVGKFSYRQPKQNPMMQQNPYMQRQMGTMTTYVRSGDDEEVYAVEGFLGSAINRDASAFRNKQLLKVNKSDLNKITFSYPADSSFTIIKNENTWMCDGVALDSAKVVNYLSGIQNLRGSSFNDALPANYSHTVTIQDNKMQSIDIKAFLKEEEALLTSSQNTGSVFKESKDRNFKTLFVSKSSLMK